MSSGTRTAALALLLALLAGCAHRQKATPPPPVAQAPIRPPSEMSSLASPMPPSVPVDSERPLKLDAAPPPEPSPSEERPPKRQVRHHPKPADHEGAQEAQHAAPSSLQDAAPNNPPQDSKVAASDQPPEMSPIGQLSTTNDSANTADRHDIASQIDRTEIGLNTIKRGLSSDEQKTAAQIRTFIARARDALKADDLDGARTLSTKARLLLQELMK